MVAKLQEKTLDARAARNVWKQSANLTTCQREGEKAHRCSACSAIERKACTSSFWQMWFWRNKPVTRLSLNLYAKQALLWEVRPFESDSHFGKWKTASLCESCSSEADHATENCCPRFWSIPQRTHSFQRQAPVCFVLCFVELNIKQHQICRHGPLVKDVTTKTGDSGGQAWAEL